MAILKRVCDDDPRPIREIRPEIPEYLSSIVMKLLSKDPEDRYATAQELAKALERRLAALQRPGIESDPEEDGVEGAPVGFESVQPKSKHGSRWSTVAAIAAGFFVIVAVGASNAGAVQKIRTFVETILRIKTADGVLVVKVHDPEVKVRVDGDTNELVVEGADLREFRLKPGKHKVTALKGEKLVYDQEIVISRGGSRVVEILREVGEEPLASAQPALERGSIAVIDATDKDEAKNEIPQALKDEIKRHVDAGEAEFTTSDGRGVRVLPDKSMYITDPRTKEEVKNDVPQPLKDEIKRHVDAGETDFTTTDGHGVKVLPDKSMYITDPKEVPNVKSDPLLDVRQGSEKPVQGAQAAGEAVKEIVVDTGLRGTKLVKASLIRSFKLSNITQNQWIIISAKADRCLYSSSQLNEPPSLALCDLSEGKVLGKFPELASVTLAFFSSDSSLFLAVTKQEKEFNVYDASTLKLLWKREFEVFEANQGYRGSRFSPDGKSLLVTMENGILVLDAKTGKEQTRYQLGGTPARFDVSPDGKTIVVMFIQAPPRRQMGIASLFFILFDTASGKAKKLEINSNTAHALIFSPDGKKLVLSEQTNNVQLWDLERSATALWLSNVWAFPTLSNANLMAFSMEEPGEAGNPSVYFCRQDDPKIIGKIGARLRNGGLYRRFTPDGKTLVTVDSDGTVQYWDVTAIIEAAGTTEQPTLLRR